MRICGIGTISARGRGIDNYKKALEQGWVAPLGELPAYRVSNESISDKIVLKKVRRADRVSKMAVLSAQDALVDSKLDLEKVKSSLGIIVATAFGAHATTFRFLDDILEYGQASVSPTTFSNSVHNAIGSYVSSVLGATGPTLTVTQFVFSFHQALILAKCWLHQGRCENVLVGTVDEYASVMEYVYNKKLNIAKDGKIKPFEFSCESVAVAGEGSVFFLLKNEESKNTYCSINEVSVGEFLEDESDITILDADGMIKDEREYKSCVFSDKLISGYSPIYGSMLTGSSFSSAAGALILKEQVQYSTCDNSNPHSLNLSLQKRKAKINKASCIRINCDKKKGIIKLERG